MTNKNLYNIALTQIFGIGDILTKNLIAYCGSSEAVFHEKKSHLEKIPGIGTITASTIIQGKQDALTRAEEELVFIEKYKIETLFFTDENYPARLKHCVDSPPLLYFKGNANLNNEKIISIVGTRNATDYGKDLCKNLIEELASLNITVVSGLAYGIDITAHKVCVENNIPTIGVLAHGLDKIYPAVHKPTAEKMIENGGILTDFISKTKPDKENFPKRNRIVAGIADATIVIESATDGGSLITAKIANSYNRDVFAFPGNIGKKYSEGCNELIKKNQAALITCAKDVIDMMLWEPQPTKKKKIQKELFVTLSTEEEKIVSVLKEKEKLHIDDICHNSKMPISKASALLLNLEFSGLIKSLPGKMYELV